MNESGLGLVLDESKIISRLGRMTDTIT